MYKRNAKEYRDLNENPITNCGITVGLVNEASYDDWRITLTALKILIIKMEYLF